MAAKQCADCENAECDVRVAKDFPTADNRRLHYDVIFLDFMLNKSDLRHSLKWISTITDLMEGNDKRRLRHVINQFHTQFRACLQYCVARKTISNRARMISRIIKSEQNVPVLLLKRLIDLVHTDCLPDYLQVRVNGKTQALIDKRRELINAILKLDGLAELHKVYLVFKDERGVKTKEQQKLAQIVDKTVKAEVSTAAPTTKSPSKDTAVSSQIAARELREKIEPERGIVTKGNRGDEEANDASSRALTLPVTSTRTPPVTQKMSEKIRDNTQQKGTSSCTPTARSKKKTSKKVSSSSREQSTTLLSLSDDDKSDDDSDDEEEAELSSPVVERVSRMLLRRGRKRVREEDSEESAAKRRSEDELQRLQIEADKQVRLFEIFMRFAEQRILDLPKKQKIELATQVYKALVSKDVHIANNTSVLCEKIAGVHRL